MTRRALSTVVLIVLVIVSSHAQAPATHSTANGEWPTYGYRRLTAMMRRLGWTVNGKRVRRWMEELQLTGEPPKRTTRTTNSKHAFPRYPNLVKELEISRPDQAWVADITYIRLHTLVSKMY